MEKSLFYPGAINESFIEKLAADRHVETRKKIFYLLATGYCAYLRKRPSSSAIR